MYVIGIDVGTTGTKSILIDKRGKIISSAYKGYQLVKPGKSYVEQRAEDWWDAVVYTVRECTCAISDKHNILAVSLSTQGGSLVPVDVNGDSLSNAIVWMDKRGSEQQRDLLNIYPDEFYYRKTGWKLNAWGNLIQIKWLKDNLTEVFQNTHKFLSTIEYINFKLTGRYVIDHTNGGITCLMDIISGVWDKELLAIAGIDDQKLAEVMEPGVEIGSLTLKAAERLGLNTSVKVINGGHDQYCAAVGAGAFSNGELLLSTGTAWAILGIFGEPVFDTTTYIAPGRHIISGLWGALATVPTGGVSMEWFRENFGLREQNGHKYKSESFKKIDDKASVRMEIAETLFFYPYYNGSGFPYYNTKARACFMGLGLEHDRYDMALAIMEGVAFEANCIIQHFNEKGCKAANLRMLGGGSKSELWTEITSAVTGVPVVRLKESDVACIGAAIIAGVGSGMFTDYKEGYRKTMGDETYTEAKRDIKDFYSQKYEKYMSGIKYIESYYA